MLKKTNLSSKTLPIASIKQAKIMNPLFKNKCKSNKAAISCLQAPLHTIQTSFNRFLPSAEILQAISSALLLQNTPISVNPNPTSWGHFFNIISREKNNKNESSPRPPDFQSEADPHPMINRRRPYFQLLP